MAYTDNWTSAFEATPAGTESKSLGDDRIRELKVAIRERCRDGWWDETGTIAYVSSTTFTIVGDYTTRYVADRAVKLIVTAGTKYTYVSSSSYDSGTGKTTVTTRDAYLDSGLSEVYFGEYPDSSARRSTSSLHFLIQGNAAVGTKLSQALVTDSQTASKVTLYADTAPVGSGITVDVNKNGTTIFSSKPSIADGAHSGNSTSISNGAFTAGDRISVDIDAIGSSTAGGNDLLVTVDF